MTDKQIEIVGSEQVDWKQYRKIRLEMLKMDPKAFNTKIEDEVARPESHWAEKLADENNTFAFAKHDHDIVGVMNLSFREDGEPDDVSILHGAYVNRDFRGLGVGKQLLDFLIDRARKIDGAKTLKLWVKEYQTRAVGLYQKSGFEVVEKVGDHTLIMERRL